MGNIDIIQVLHVTYQFKCEGLYSLNGKTSYWRIPWSFEAVGLDTIIIVLPWYHNDCKGLNPNVKALKLHDILRSPSAKWIQAMVKSTVEKYVFSEFELCFIFCSSHSVVVGDIMLCYTALWRHSTVLSTGHVSWHKRSQPYITKYINALSALRQWIKISLFF